MKLPLERISKVMFFFSIGFFVFAYGVAVGFYRIFPYDQIVQAKNALEELRSVKQYYRAVNHSQKVAVRNMEGAYPGVNLVTSTVADDELSAKIIDMEGKTIHEWNVDWFDIWPADETDHVPAAKVPKSRPGTEIHGAVVMENGDLVFSYYNLGLVRLSVSGEVVWRLPYMTHHSVHLHDDGNLWVSGLKIRDEPVPEYSNYVPPFDEFTVLEISGDGEILQEISVFELLQKNQLHGLLYMMGTDLSTKTGGDTLHLNDVEIFPSDFKSDFFDQGDIMISLRNINTVLVFERDSLDIKYITFGTFVRQHDADFIDGRTISVFDNNNVGNYESGAQSRILMFDAPTDEVTVAFEGNKDIPFYTHIKGKHQWLPNGNLLVTESVQGRAFELNPQGEIVWEYINYLLPDFVGSVTEVTRLPASYSDLYLEPALK